MQTVNGVPRSNTTNLHSNTKSCTHSTQEGILKDEVENLKYNNQKLKLELNFNCKDKDNVNEEQGTNVLKEKMIGNYNDVAHAEKHDDFDKKKEKRWTLGGFFRRKNKKDADDSSEDTDERGGFLSRRKSKREKRKVRNTANGFDVVIPQLKDNNLSNGHTKAVDELWCGTPAADPVKLLEKKSSSNSYTPVRYIHRHHDTSVGTDLSKANINGLQVPKHSRKDSSLSRSSGGSDNVDKKSRKEIMARAEAKRELIHDESSSDENESHQSNSSLNKLNFNTPGHRRHRRSDRYHKRFSKDEFNLVYPKGSDFRMIKSDLEGGRHYVTNGWQNSRCHYVDSSDHENARLNLMNHSGMSSPSRSPRVRQKQLLQYMSTIQNSYPTRTFPPGVHHLQQLRNPPSLHSIPSDEKRVTNLPIHNSQPFINTSYRNIKQNRNSDYIFDFPRSISVTDNPPSRKPELGNDKVLFCGAAKEKSLSYDQDIYHASYFENDSEGLPRSPLSYSTNIDNKLASSNFKKHKILTNDSKNAEDNNFNTPQNFSKAFGNQNGAVKNRTDSTPSLSFLPGNFPYQPAQTLKKSASGNTFCDSYENTIRFIPNRSNSHQHIPSYLNGSPNTYFNVNGNHIVTETLKSPPSEKPHMFHHSQNHNFQREFPSIDNAKDNEYKNNDTVSNSNPKESQLVTTWNSPIGSSSNDNSFVLRYYADQNPRSRNPLHITCNPTTTSHNIMSSDEVTDSQQHTTEQKNSRRSASDFWKLKDQELIFKNSQNKSEIYNKPPFNVGNVKLTRSLTSSPRLKVLPKATESTEEKFGGKQDSRSKVVANETNNDKKSSEITPKVRTDRQNIIDAKEIGYNMKIPPEPPVRRSSKADVLARLNKYEELNKEKESNIDSSNLDDALNELESVYNSLRLKDEDLIDRAERRDFPFARPYSNIKEYNSISVRDKIQNFYAETEFSHNHFEKTINPSDSTPIRHQRAVPLRRSRVPDKVYDDMAVRRMSSKERMNNKELPTPSYLRSSPALSPVCGRSSVSPKQSLVTEPDVTYDDVVFRNIRRANTTLKIQDPQPPFGIPIGVVTPAPNSDYLHATPQERFRPTFSSSKSPDVVKDDLAFRNLRKDTKMNSSGSVLDVSKADSGSMLKKRAIRSLSANLYNIMQKENTVTSVSTKENVALMNNDKKTQSLTDLFSPSKSAKEALERKLKELKNEKNSKRAEFFELDQKPDKIAEKDVNFSNFNGRVNSSANPENCLKEALNKIENKNNIKSKEEARRFTEALIQTPEKKDVRSPIIELSKYPSAAPKSSIQDNHFGEPVVDEDLDNILSIIAVEAKTASEDLDKQLNELKMKNKAKSDTLEHDTESIKGKSKLLDDFNKKYKIKSSDSSKRRRNLSLSNINETKEEIRKTGSLERKRKKRQSSASLKNEDWLFLDKVCTKIKSEKKNSSRCKENELMSEVSPEICETFDVIISDVPVITEPSYEAARNDEEGSLSTASELGSPNVTKTPLEEPVDLSEIFHGVQMEQQLNEEISEEQTENKASSLEDKDFFQEVYEYNCKLGENKVRNEKDSKEIEQLPSQKKVHKIIKVVTNKKTSSDDDKELMPDLELEFEKLHKEVHYDRTNTIDVSSCDDRSNDLVDSEATSKNSVSHFYYPGEEEATSSSNRFDWSTESRNGRLSNSRKGEGEVNKKADFHSNVWLACSYALAFAFRQQDIDMFTALGIVLAVISIIAILIL